LSLKKSIGFFGGTFDPIHFGHIQLALQLLEIHHLDEVLFCPAFCSPSKLTAPPVASPKDRLAMLRLSLEEIPQFKISSLEIDRQGPSFTIDTLRILSEKMKDVQWHLLLSKEAASDLDEWKDTAELIRLAPPLIGSRGPGSPLSKGITQTKVFEISSSDVRQRLKSHLYCGHLVPAPALKYIKAHRLYTESDSRIGI
jgi:nicotinate-nucleotide adenylyltransferase